MITGDWLPVIFFAAILFLLLLIIRFKINPFLALLLVSILTGIAVNMPLADISSNIGKGFGNTLQGIGIVIGLGIMLGKILSESGATTVVANLLLKSFGRKNASLAMTVTGLIVSIPVFFDAAFVILVSLARNISILVTGFLLAALLRAALGSSTVALITASSILAPMVVNTEASSLLLAISICLGGLCLSLPNDSGFWVVSRFSGLTITQTLKSWTLGSTLAGVTGFLIVLIISTFI